ncbi:MAG: IS1182 family transposase, partial [Planctomycetota bacterium]
DPVPDYTIRVARAAFPKGNPSLTLRDQLGVIFQDDDFVDLYPGTGQPGLSPWRLAWVTILQFRETLSDRQAAEAVRARIDWEYLLGLDLMDPGFDFSVLSEFRDRLLAGSAEERLLDKLLERCQDHGLLKARGQQRTDSTHVLAAIRVLNRLELVGETLRAALNELAGVAPEWLQSLAPLEWYERYSKRIEDSRLPREQSKRDAYAHTVGEDGFALLDAFEDHQAPPELRDLPIIDTLRRTWQRHYERRDDGTATTGEGGERHVRFKANRELPKAAEGIESPYDLDARYRTKRDTQWTGYMVHVSETCEEEAPHLLTHVHTTAASVHEAKCTDAIHQGLSDKDLAPGNHLVDAAYVDAELLVTSRQDHGITLRGPTRPTGGWQTQVEGAYTVDQFLVDWDRQVAYCPQGQCATAWMEQVTSTGQPCIIVKFRPKDCQACAARELCTHAKDQPRRLMLPPREQYEALQAARAWYASEEGQEMYKRRAGVEGTLSQGVRAFGMRRTRYAGLEKVHLQNVAIAAAINVERLVAWFDGRPQAQTRTSRFATLAPAHPTGPG